CLSITCIDDVIERLNGSQIFSKLDLRSGYFQVPLTPEKRAKTAFTTSDGLWEFTILPQGLKKFTISFSMINEPNPWMITLGYMSRLLG
ncbi:unnamed protein product, partial [Rotaria sp. Silwood1]